jgi:hypothetical protein
MLFDSEDRPPSRRYRRRGSPRSSHSQAARLAGATKAAAPRRMRQRGPRIRRSCRSPCAGLLPWTEPAVRTWRRLWPGPRAAHMPVVAAARGGRRTAVVRASGRGSANGPMTRAVAALEFAVSEAQSPGSLSSLVRRQCSRRQERLSSVAAQPGAALLASVTAAAQHRNRQRGQECRNGDEAEARRRA